MFEFTQTTIILFNLFLKKSVRFTFCVINDGRFFFLKTVFSQNGKINSSSITFQNLDFSPTWSQGYLMRCFFSKFQ